MSDPLRYDAFISYSHAADEQLAPAIQRGLHQLARPWYKLRALNVFRDTTGLSANPGLWTSIAEAMDQSRHFILLASPDAARSEWVGKEIKHWLATKPRGAILPVVTDGEWRWDAAANDFDWEASTAVPPALHGVFSEEPRHVDLRWARSETDLSLRNSRFLDQLAELAAPLHGVSKDQLVGEDVRRHRSVRRLTRAVAGVLAVLTIAAVVASIIAVRSAEQAVAEASRARAGALASQAELLGHAPDLQLLLHVAALDLDPDPFNQRALLRTLLSRPLVAYWRPDRPDGPLLLRLAAVDPSARIAVFTGDRDDESGHIDVWDLARRQHVAARVLSFSQGLDPAIGNQVPDGHIALPMNGVLAASEGRIVFSTVTGQLVAWDRTTDELTVISSECLSLEFPRPMGVSSDGSVLAVTCARSAEDGRLVYDLGVSVGDRPFVKRPLPGEPSGIDISPDGTTIAVAANLEPERVAHPFGTLLLHDVATGQERGRAVLRTGGSAAIRFGHDGTGTEVSWRSVGSTVPCLSSTWQETRY